MVGVVIINNTDYKLKCRFFGQNRILLLKKSATCFIYRFAGITGPIPRISKEENDMVAILVRDLEPYNVL